MVPFSLLLLWGLYLPNKVTTLHPPVYGDSKISKHGLHGMPPMKTTSNSAYQDGTLKSLTNSCGCLVSASSLQKYFSSSVLVYFFAVPHYFPVVDVFLFGFARASIQFVLFCTVLSSEKIIFLSKGCAYPKIG